MVSRRWNKLTMTWLSKRGDFQKHEMSTLMRMSRTFRHEGSYDNGFDHFDRVGSTAAGCRSHVAIQSKLGLLA